MQQSQLETQKYLNQIGIQDADEIRRIFRMTKGLPYYLKVIKEQNDRGEDISFSSGRDEIADRLLHGLNSTERKVVQLAAHCRWFDKTIIKYLLKEKISEIGEESANSNDWFAWLKERDFVIEEDHYRIEDVMRDIVRAALCRDDERDFRDIHKLLANYFSQLADEAVSHNSHISEKYQDSEWKECMIEMTYHSLFASRNEGPHNLLIHFFEGAHFKQPDIARSSFTAIVAEAELEENQLLPKDTRKFLNSIGSAIAFGWQVIGIPPSHYEFQIQISESEEPDSTTDIKEQIEIALRKCFQKSSALSGLAKYMELSGKAVRCLQPSQRKKLLEQASKAIESVIDSEYPNFSGGLFCSIGHGFDSVEAFDEALVSFQAAAEIDPESYEAFVNQGDTFWKLEQKREALTTYDVAIRLDPDHYAAWNNKGSCLLTMGNYSDALCSLEKAIQLKPEEELCWFNKGRILEVMGLYEDALSSYDRAIELEPKKTIEYGLHKIDLLRYMRLYEKAVTHCNQFLKHDNNHSNTFWNSRGLCLSLLQAYDEALLSLEKAIKTDESKGISTSVANKCIVLARAGNCERALVLCEQYLQTNTDEFGHYAQACCYAIQGNDELVLQALSRAIDLNPNLCRTEARANPDFDNLRQNKQFKTLIDRQPSY